MVGAVLVQQHLDAAVRGGLERLLPACRRAAVPSGLLAPPLDRVRSSCSRQRSRTGRETSSSSVGVACACACVQPTTARRTSFESRSSSSPFVSSEHTITTPRAAQPAHLPVELVRDAPEMILDERLDVPLVVRLRPAALVVPSGRSSEWSATGYQPTAVEPVHLPARDRPARRGRPHRDRRAGRAARGRSSSHLDLVGHGIGQREREPEVVQPRTEDATPCAPSRLNSSVR